MKTSLAGLKDRFAPQSRWGAVDLAPRRTNRGGVSWTNAEDLPQPQDGASEVSSAVKGPVSILPRMQFGGAYAKLNEPEDARLTGSTRSLGRRLLGLNVAARPKQTVRQGLLPQRVGGMTGQTQVA